MKQLNTFGISRYLKVPSLSLEWVPIVDILLIIFCLSLLGSKYVFPLGLTIELPEAVDKEEVHGIRAQVVLTMAGGDMVLFEGRRFSLGSFSEYMSTLGGDEDRGPILLRLNKSLDMQSLLKVCGAVRKGGYTSVHIAASVDEEPGVIHHL